MSFLSYVLISQLITSVCWVLTTLIIGDNVASPQVIGSHCSEKCGNISIPYPFGVEKGCYYDDEVSASTFKINCSHNTNPPTPTFGTDMEVLSISVESELRTMFAVSYTCYNNQSGVVQYLYNQLNMVTFTVSSTKNILVAIGCDTYVLFTGSRHGKAYRTGCMTQCVDPNDVIDGDCSGIGCCQSSISSGVSNIVVEALSIFNHTSVYQFNPCSVAFVVAKDAFRFDRANLSNSLPDFRLSDGKEFPLVLDWSIGKKNCSTVKQDKSCLCNENAECYDPEHKFGYRCKCRDGYSGNAYLSQGCKDIDECALKEKNGCEKPEYCTNTIGGYYCKCPKGYHGNGTKTDHCISSVKAWLIPVSVTAGVSGGIIFLLLCGFLLNYKHGKRQIRKMRESFFQQNGGFLLHEKLSTRHVDSLNIFTVQDLQVACNNYSDQNIIGRGGFGIVYKGILPNNQVVAIKKSLKVDPNQVEQFINEILVLSQINNKNIVKLVGCCLESEVPLLVYEFINNGTLYDHLHDVVKASILTWPLRLKIASEVANVLSYLHNTISMPIIHRDMKSMNILLDESYSAKVTDFGASRLVTPDRSLFATMVLGTRGYLDPEYLQTSELTEKSDVYSFGVVLVELLTRKKAICNVRPEEERCLAMHFLLKFKDGLLLDILDINIVCEETIEEIQQMANLAKCCMMLKGEERPTMQEVAIELENIRRKGSIVPSMEIE